ncbi:hypothetical protein N789_00935 [Arenimonas oryziterrae DSM 21050 = YC6267]|uniref:Type II secretion system protein GspG C-terminal domain-containing protein n=2 Tax=Arenimonas TaxID=490567 RepID=A0A091B154_9GAMM|nr:hypothetical protein N789_00935 [Arenimonas oryziterrae DSM 21050 = YC6267]
MKKIWLLIVAGILISFLTLAWQVSRPRDTVEGMARGRTRAQVSTLCGSVATYFADGKGHRESFELSELWRENPPYMKEEDLIDGWGRPLLFGRNEVGDFYFESFGSNGINDLSGDGDDLSCVVKLPAASSE